MPKSLVGTIKKPLLIGNGNRVVDTPFRNIRPVFSIFLGQQTIPHHELGADQQGVPRKGGYALVRGVAMI